MRHTTRLVTFALFLLTLTACSPPGNGPLQQGAINLVVSGLPTGVDAAITVSGPGGFLQIHSGNAQIPELTPGQYTVSASPVTVGETSYQPQPPSQNVTVTANTPRTATVSYSETDPDPGPGTVDLGFNAEVPGTLADTGFTLVQGGNQFLIEGNLTLNTAAGTLAIDAQPGLQFQDANSLQNGLGVTVDATTQGKVIETTFLKPAFLGSGNQNLNQQAGLWYGQPDNQDNYVKLVVISTAADESTSAIELRREVSGATVETPDGLRRTESFNIATGATVTLRLVVQPSGVATGFYSVDGAAFQQVGTGGVALSSEAVATGWVERAFLGLRLDGSAVSLAAPPIGPGPIPIPPFPPDPLPPFPPEPPIPPFPIPPIGPIPPFPPEPPTPPFPIPPIGPIPPFPIPPIGPVPPVDPTPPDPTPPTPPDPTPPDPTPPDPTPPDPTPPMPPGPTPPTPPGPPPGEPPVSPPPAQPLPSFELVTPASAAGIMASRRGDTSGSLNVVFTAFKVTNASD